jgi:hypothetical protein
MSDLEDPERALEEVVRFSEVDAVMVAIRVSLSWVERFERNCEIDLWGYDLGSF